MHTELLWWYQNMTYLSAEKTHFYDIDEVHTSKIFSLSVKRRQFLRVDVSFLTASSMWLSEEACVEFKIYRLKTKTKNKKPHVSCLRQG